jgi:hypothetical protein
MPINRFIVRASPIKNTAINDANKGDMETNGVDSVAVNLFKVENVRNLPRPVAKRPAIKKIINELGFGNVLVE